MARSRRRIGAALALAGGVILADQATKWLVRESEASLPFKVLSGLRLELHYNSGVSFSFLAGRGDVVTVLVAGVAAAVSVALLLAPRRYSLPLGLLLGGAVGNLIDRLRFGAVVDFVGILSWPTFNVADVAIVVGTALVAFGVLREPRD